MAIHLRELVFSAFFLLPLAGTAAELVISQVAPLSGPLAPTGKHLQAGAQLLIDSVNAHGGVHGAKLRLKSHDDGYKVSETIRLTRHALREDRPIAFFGLVGTGNVEALLAERVIDDAGLPVVTVRSGAASVMQSGSPWFFYTRSSYANEVAKIARQYLPLGYRRVAVFYQDDAFGKDGLLATRAEVKAQEGELVVEASYPKNTTEVGAAVNAIAAANPALVVMISNTAASAEFVRLFRARGNLAQLVTLSTTDAAQVVEKIGKPTAHGLALTQVVPDPGDTRTPLVREIQEAARKFPPHGVSVNHTFIEGYLGARVLVEGLRRAGPAPTPARLRAALESLNAYNAGGLPISFSGSNHAGSRYVDITIIGRNGTLIR